MKTLHKSAGLAVLIAASVAATALAPQAAFAKGTKHKRASSRSAAVAGGSVGGGSSYERRLRQMEDEISALRQELARSRSEVKAETREATEKLEAQRQQFEQQLAEEKAHEQTHHDLLFFRGGYAQLEHARGNELLTGNNTLAGLTGTPNPGKSGEGWYVGAGFDHRLTDDLWGITDMAALDGEVMFEYQNFGANTNSFVNAQLAALGLPTKGIKNQVTQFTLTASPKIKFNNLGIFRPWIIPFGLSINVVSPPSSGVTVLNPGLMLGTGMEVNLWKDLWAGIDFRYQFTGGDLSYKYQANGTTILNRVNTDGLTTGAYIGFGF
ncbi:MAP7 domain-containing protein [Candidatus Methylocalor cossyra]|uniref:Outer membrane protein beta-barrel domain-containing protein n=1 Tax=Candidatus Methylocalor cossyra TaxID=3108543 RepID=A0ABM9NJ97_9GAMM